MNFALVLLASFAKTTAAARIDLETEPEWLWDSNNNGGAFAINDYLSLRDNRAENFVGDWRSIACQKPIEGRVMYVVQIDPKSSGQVGIGFLPSTTLIREGRQMLERRAAQALQR